MNIRKKTVVGILWNFGERFGLQVMQFIISVFLTRLLTPADYGLIGMIAVFPAIANTLVDSGLSISLIRSKNVDEDDLTTIFYFNLIVSVIIYITIYLSSGWIAYFFDVPLLINLIRVISLTVIINAFSTIQITKLTRELNFKKQFSIQLPSSILSGIIGIIMALNGYGVWSLVGYMLAGAIIKNIQLWLIRPWIPSGRFSSIVLKRHLRFGINLAGTNLLATLFQNSYNVVIGKFFAVSTLGYFTKAQNLQQLPISNIITTIKKVSLPMFAQLNGNDETIKKASRRVIKIAMLLLIPIVVIIFVFAKPIVITLYTEKWIDVVPMLQILILVGLTGPLNAFNINILNVKGKSDVVFKIEIVNKLLVSFVLVLGVLYGLDYILWGITINSFITYILNSLIVGKLINYNLKEQILDILPFLIMGLVTTIFSYLIYTSNIFQEIIPKIQIVFGMVLSILIYFIFIFIFQKKELFYLKNIFIELKNK